MKKITYYIIYMCFLMGQQSYAQTIQLWGVTQLGGKDTLGNIFSINSDGSNFHNALSFNGINGSNPVNALLEASNGKLYGVSEGGGTGTYSTGTMFNIDPITDSFNVLHDFIDINKGWNPESNLIQLSNGLIYGMTNSGGNFSSGNTGGYGVIFSFNPVNNQYTRLYAFKSNVATGCAPGGQNLMQASNYKLYGCAQDGAYFYSSSGVDNGVIFSLDISDSLYTDLYNFNNTTAGNYPGPSLTEGTDGKLYGSAGAGKYGGGVIFSFDTSTNTYKDLFNLYDTLGRFSGTLVQLSNGKFYGTCYAGGYGDGVIFSYDPSDSSYERLYEFTGYSGENPSDLLLASDGNLYGTTINGGFYGQGNVFRFNPDSNTFKDIFDFDSTEGLSPTELIEYKKPAGLQQLSANNNQLSIYPNPSGGIFTIKSSKAIDVLKVTNLLGQVICTSQPKQTQFTFNIDAAGMYFVTVTEDNETETKKVIVAK